MRKSMLNIEQFEDYYITGNEMIDVYLTDDKRQMVIVNKYFDEDFDAFLHNVVILKTNEKGEINYNDDMVDEVVADDLDPKGIEGWTVTGVRCILREVLLNESR